MKSDFYRGDVMFFSDLFRAPARLIVIVVFLALLFSVQSAFCENRSAQDASILLQKQERLWQEALQSRKTGADKDAASLFFRFYKKYPETDRGEDALWYSLTLQKSLALQSGNPDWQALKDGFRLFITEFPQSSHLSQAYFEVGMSFFRMHYSREALTYFKLYAKRFPRGERVDEARFMQTRCLLDIGKLDEAGEVFSQLGQSSKKVFRLRGQAGEGHIFFARKEYHAALGVYLKILRHNPQFYVDDPALLYRMGIANLNVGNEEEGRRNLFIYLNLAGKASFTPKVLFEIAESYLREQNEQAAQKLYLRIIETGTEDGREVVMSRFRLAQFREAYEEKQKGDDQPFQSVLDQYYNDEIAQDARYSLIKRHWARQEYDRAHDMGKPYLRYQSDPDRAAEVTELMGRILILRVEQLLKEKKYEEVYQLYHREYVYVKKVKGGRLLYLIGRAFESMGLYDQASVVYYRSLALDLSDEDKIDIYLHRSEVYLAKNDLQAAQRLLKYLRMVYVDEKEIGEFYSLSGRLREAQGRPDDALVFYKMAAASPTFAEKKGRYGGDYLRCLFQLNQVDEVEKILAEYRKTAYLTPIDLQSWYGRLGDTNRTAGDLQAAGKAYLAALGDTMPQEGEQAQKMNLRYGDVLVLLGENSDSINYFERAAAGNDPLLKKIALARLEELDINRQAAEVGGVVKK